MGESGPIECLLADALHRGIVDPELAFQEFRSLPGAC